MSPPKGDYGMHDTHAQSIMDNHRPWSTPIPHIQDMGIWIHLMVYETARRHSCTAMAYCSARVSLQGLSLYTVLTMWSIA